MKESKQTKYEFWKPHVAAASRHPKGIRAYCQENQIDHTQFYYWKNKVLIGNIHPTRRLAKSSFIPITIEPKFTSVRELPDARWLAHFAVELIRGLHQ